MLGQKTLRLLERFAITPNADAGQNFLVDGQIANLLVNSAEIKPADIILEIGAGTGTLTKVLASKAKAVFAVENDARLFEALSIEMKDTANVCLVFGDALSILQKKGTKKYKRLHAGESNLVMEGGLGRYKINKIVANLPYQLCEPIMHALLFSFGFECAALIVPRTFAKFLQTKTIAKAHIDVEVIAEVQKSAFFPQPKTKSVIVLVRPRKKYSNGLLLAKYMYLLEPMKLKNALRESIIKIYSARGTVITKKQVRAVVSGFGFSKAELETKVHDASEETMKKAVEKVDKLKI